MSTYQIVAKLFYCYDNYDFILNVDYLSCQLLEILVSFLLCHTWFVAIFNQIYGDVVFVFLLVIIVVCFWAFGDLFSNCFLKTMLGIRYFQKFILYWSVSICFISKDLNEWLWIEINKKLIFRTWFFWFYDRSRIFPRSSWEYVIRRLIFQLVY